MYALKISRGYLTIRPADTTVCELWLNSTRILQCNSANAAAQLVAQKHTGRIEIDDEPAALPANIDGWSWISVSKSRPPPASTEAASSAHR
jgi:hypothetical protein